ncbi:MAG: SPOR domain-containing protein [Burkholderiales bacterium]|nr:SPOR domain-containing protein [Burkholderiales bacterium]
MRWLALLLLLANLALGAYLAFRPLPLVVMPDIRALELNPERVKALPRIESSPAPATGAKPAPAACLEWGNFAAAELERAQELLAKQQVKSRVRELGRVAAWWVYVTPLRSRDEAERRLRELDELGVRDASVVTDDRWRNAISLGIFKTEETALAHQARMRESKVRNVAVVQRGDLLRLSSLVIADPSTALVGRVTELAAAFAGTELKAIACPPGA